MSVVLKNYYILHRGSLHSVMPCGCMIPEHPTAPVRAQFIRHQPRLARRFSIKKTRARRYPRTNSADERNTRLPFTTLPLACFQAPKSGKTH